MPHHRTALATTVRLPLICSAATSRLPRNQIWLADITYIETDQGWLYLAAILILYSRRVVGWAMGDHLRTALPLDALQMAIKAQRPGAGLIHHSDRGVQYAFYRLPQDYAGRRLPGLDEPHGRLL